MKKTILITALLTIMSSLAFAQDLNKTTLCKKWNIHHCRYMWKNYPPEEKEKNDYIQFNNNMTYVSVDEGEKSTGKWLFDAKNKYIIMINDKNEKIKIVVEELSEKELVFEIDDKELKGVEFYYNASFN